MTCTRPEQFAALVAAVVPDEVRAGLSAEDLSVDAPTAGPAAELLEYHFVERLVDDWCSSWGSEASRPRASGRRAGSTVMPSSNRRCSTTAAPTPSSTCTAASAVGDLVHLRRQSSARRGRAPLLGEHIREVLGELGYDDAIAELIEASAVLASADVS